MRGSEAGLTHIDAALEHELANYDLAHSARADMYCSLGRLMRSYGVDLTGAEAAIPASADSPAEIKDGVAVDIPFSQRL